MLSQPQCLHLSSLTNQQVGISQQHISITSRCLYLYLYLLLEMTRFQPLLLWHASFLTVFTSLSANYFISFTFTLLIPVAAQHCTVYIR